MYEAMFRQMRKTLVQIDKWLEMAKAHAEAKALDPKGFLEMRLAPDQFPFVKQVQGACDVAKAAASRLTGKEAPAMADTEQSLDELRTRVQATVAYLDTFTAKDFAGAESRTVTQPRWEGKTMTGADYFIEHAVPNFYFHTSHAYAILRHAGVPLGKRDFLGTLTMRAPS